MRLKIGFFLISIFILFNTFYFISDLKDEKMLRISFLNVGQGDSILIESPNGIQVLIDAGEDAEVKRSLSKEMEFYDHSIDLAVLSHLDSDHIGGFIDLFSGYSLEMYIVSSTSTKKNALISSIFNELHKDEIPIRITNVSDRIVLDEENGIYMDILHPDDEKGLSNKENDNSIVIKLVYGEISFLFTGDISSAVESDLVSIYGDQLKSNVLKIAHHGSKSSSSLEFLEKVDPDFAVISFGEGNRYGHPHDEVISRLNEMKIEILNTKEGNINLITDGKNIFNDTK